MNRLIDVVAEARETNWTNSAYVSDEEVLGVALAQWADWDGERILRVAMSAFEDANFHTWNGVMEEAWNTPGNKGGVD